MENQIISSPNRTNAFLQYDSALSFGAPARSNKIYKSDEVFLIEEARKNNPSPTSIPYKKTKEISQLQVKQAKRQ